MFYQEEKDNALRFGDVLKGYISTIPHIDKPILNPVNTSYNINVKLPIFSVIITPCCSIEDKTISLTPLIEVSDKFFNNSYFAEDLTRINRKMKPQQSVSLEIWSNFNDEEKQKRLEEGFVYALPEFFIYEENDIFPEYIINRKRGNIRTKFYMINFKNVYELYCEKIITPKDAPLESKYLQLSVQTRSELRDKLSSYYARVPKEDKVLED